LPVELLNFTASVVDNNKVQLNWQTASEVNNNFFTVERSVDAQQWQAINTIKGKGNAQTTTLYEAYDDHPYKSISYYRLKQTDKDGKFTYSSIRKIHIALQQTALRLYPNPVQNSLTIEGNVAALSGLRIYNVSGADFTGMLHKKAVNNNKMILDMGKAPQGVYYLKTKSTVYKIVKQ